MLKSMKVCWLVTPWTMACWLSIWISQAKNTGVSCPFPSPKDLPHDPGIEPPRLSVAGGILHRLSTGALSLVHSRAWSLCFQPEPFGSYRSLVRVYR